MACRLYTPVPTEAFLLPKRKKNKQNCLDIVCVQLPTQISTLLYVYVYSNVPNTQSLVGVRSKYT